MKHKRIVATVLSLVMMASLLSACAAKQSETNALPVVTRQAHNTVPLQELSLSASQSSYQLQTLAYKTDAVTLPSVTNGADENGITYNEDQIIRLLKGAALLAAGGGGSYHLGVSILDAFKEQNPDVPVEVTVYDSGQMKDGESTFGVAIMGSPSAHASVSDLAKVALKAYDETLALAERYDKDPQYALALELGGANTLIPLLWQ